MPSAWHRVTTTIGGVPARGRCFARSLRDPTRAVMALSFLVVFGMFCTNTDYGGDPHSARGDGEYRPVLARGDGHMTFLMMRSAVLDQDLVFDNDLRRFGDPWRQRTTKTGRKDIPHPIGPTVVWAPAMVLAHLGSKIVNVFGADIPSHGYTMWHHRVVFATSCFFAFFAVLLGLLLSRKWLGGRWPPVYSAVAVLFGTSLTYYATYMPSYGHAMDAFFCAAFLGYWGLTWGDLRVRRFVFLGLLLGICALIRVQDLGMGIVVASEVLWRIVQGPRTADSRRRWTLRLVALGGLTLIVALVAFTPQMIAWKLVNGDWITSPNGPRYVRLSHPMVLELLFSSYNGWLSTTPIAYAGVVGLFFVPRAARPIAVGLSAALIVQVWVNASVLDWWSSASFGQRRMCSVTLILVFGLAALIRFFAIRSSSARWLRHGLAIAVLGWFVVWNVSQVGILRRGKAAGHRTGPSCCRRASQPMRAVAEPIYRVVGNPFSFPANALFALRHGVDLLRWDRIVGTYVNVPPWDKYNDGRYKKKFSKWNIASGGLDSAILSGFGGPQMDGKEAYRWTVEASARALVPILLPEAHRFRIRVSSGGAQRKEASFLVNGVVYATKEVTRRWTKVEFDVPEDGLIVGENTIEIRSEIGAASQGLNALKTQSDVGVAVGPMWVGYPPE